MSIEGLSGGGPDFSALRAKFQQAGAAKFEAGDTDNSGGLSLEEFKSAKANSPPSAARPAGAPSAEEAFGKIDTDGDGEITKAEFESFDPSKLIGKFSPDTFSGVLAAQEQFGGGATPSNTESDLVTQLIEALDASEASDEDDEEDKN